MKKWKGLGFIAATASILLLVRHQSFRTYVTKVTAGTIHITSSLENNNSILKNPQHTHPVAEQKNYTRLQVVYKDLSSCPPKPKYFSQYRAHCWGKCNQGRNCQNPVSYEDTKLSAKLFCFPNLHLIGVRKAGTGDFSLKWFDGHKQVSRVQQDYFGTITGCPVEYFSNRRWLRPSSINGSLYNGGPGNLMAHTKIARNETHLTLVTAIQFLAYMSTDDTRFYVQLRNPTDRVISNLFYWHQVKLIYTHLSIDELDGGFVDTQLRKLLDEMQDCLPKYGETACVYFPDAHDGSTESLIAHSMYVIYIEEMLKFISKEKVMFKTMKEYSQDRVSAAVDVSENHFGVQFQEEMKVHDKQGIIHKSKKNPVWLSTLQLLDNFFMPYNQRLAALLQDDKWLFTVNRTNTQ